MGVPQTTGVERKSIREMKKNDYIKVQATSLDTIIVGDAVAATDELPVDGVAWATSGEPFSRYFYLIKVDKGLLISDRMWQNSVSWDTLNTSFLIEGRLVAIDGIQGQLRSPSGGVAYADANGSKSLTNQGYGAFPVNNEWDKYIVNFPQDKLQGGKTLDEVFHWNGVATWCQDTSSMGVVRATDGATGNNTGRTVRGLYTKERYSFVGSSTANTTNGYRPVFEYNENNL